MALACALMGRQHRLELKQGTSASMNGGRAPTNGTSAPRNGISAVINGDIPAASALAAAPAAPVPHARSVPHTAWHVRFLRTAHRIACP
eukprot:3823916-Rhodomonas_salina.4